MNIFGGAELPAAKNPKRILKEAEKLDETLFAGMLNPKQQSAEPSDTNDTAPICARRHSLCTGSFTGERKPQRNEISAFLNEIN